jgi:hypothetical protein
MTGNDGKYRLLIAGALNLIRKKYRQEAKLVGRKIFLQRNLSRLT